MIDFDNIRKEVAIRHNVLLGKDDPILVTVTLNQLVLDQYLATVGKHYDEANRLLSVAIQQQVEQSKQVAGKLITDSAGYVSGEVKKAVDAALSDAVLELRKDVQAAMKLQRTASASVLAAQTFEKTAMWSAIIAGVSALAAMAALAMVILK